jgi:hypothetical protein
MSDPTRGIGTGRRPAASLTASAVPEPEEPDPWVPRYDGDGAVHRSAITVTASGDPGIIYSGSASVRTCEKCQTPITDAQLHAPHCAQEAERWQAVQEFNARSRERERQMVAERQRQLAGGEVPPGRFGSAAPPRADEGDG